MHSGHSLSLQMAARNLKRTASMAGFSQPPLQRRSQSQVQRLARRVKKLSKATAASTHMLANSVVVSPLLATGTVSYLSTIAQGDTEADRNGSAVNPLELDLHLGSNLTPSTQQVRYIIFQDKQTYGAAPAVLDVLNAADPTAGFNPENALAKRFRILADWTHSSTAPSAATAQGGAVVLFHKRIRRMNKINFTGNTNAVASAGIGALYLLSITSAAANQGAFTASWNLKFNP